jgi:[protein-PII] uridylyltransferase
VAEFSYLPVTEAQEVRDFLARLPLAVDREHFTRFCLGFPRRYLATTSPVEIVKHYALVESLGSRAAISSLAREGELWKMCLLARDRTFLFTSIAGSLSLFGINIVGAEAFANSNAIILDTFTFQDVEKRLEDGAERRRFQAFVEEVAEGKRDLEAELRDRRSATPKAARPLAVAWEDEAHPFATLLKVRGEDRFGLLYDLSRVLSEAGCSIEIAHIETVGGSVRDDFFLTRDGRKLDTETKAALTAGLISMGRDEGRPAPTGIAP